MSDVVRLVSKQKTIEEIAADAMAAWEVKREREAEEKRERGTWNPEPMASNVTAENYSEIAGKFIAEHGHPVTIYRDRHPALWTLWLRYFQLREINTRAYEARGYVTVPAARPEEFDAAPWPALTLV